MEIDIGRLFTNSTQLEDFLTALNIDKKLSVDIQKQTVDMGKVCKVIL